MARKPERHEVETILELTRLLGDAVKDLDLPSPIVSSVYISLATMQFISIHPGDDDPVALAAWRDMMRRQGERYIALSDAKTHQDLLDLTHGIVLGDIQGPKN